jgi:DNA-directed RNA polymerase subunit RPC12/RpoP
MNVAAFTVNCRRCDEPISTRAKPGNTIRCPSCGYAQRLRPPGQVAQLLQDAAAGIWNPPSEPRAPGRSADPCPRCGAAAYASPRGTVRACPGCSTRVTPPAVLAPYRRDSSAAARQVKSQRERDLEALGLARRKGVMMAQLAALAADERLDPASVPVVEWFREQVKDAASDGRLDELAALLPEAGIRRRHWWQGQPAAITAGYADEDDEPEEGEDDDEDQAADEMRLATPASIAAQQHRAQPSRMTWADAIAVCGWRLSLTVGGCQIVNERSQLCGAQTARPVTGGWVCAGHYDALVRWP